MLLLLAALQAPPAQNFPEIDHPGANSLIPVVTSKLCPNALPGDRGALLKYELRFADSVSRKPTASGLVMLGCVRANLYAAGAIAHEGYLTLSGASWSDGARLAFLRALVLKKDDSRAAELLASFALEDAVPKNAAEILAALRASIDAGVRNPAVLRTCTELAIRANDNAGARKYANIALAAGVDSSWHLIELSRLSFRDADTASGLRWFTRAAGAAHDSITLKDLAWHLQWFFTPGERLSWEHIPDSLRFTFMRDLLADRDVRDGRPRGARLAEHFNRLEYVMANFRIYPARPFREALRTLPHGDPASKLENDTLVLADCEPGRIPATPFRFYKRWQTDIDDRGVVWMRFGAPAERIESTPDCGIVPGTIPTLTPPKSDQEQVAKSLQVPVDSPKFVGSPPHPASLNHREMWLYEIDGERMILSFEVEMFSGSVEATRLVSGVLGTYMCSIDAKRCGLSSLSNAAWLAKQPGGTPPLTRMVQPEDITHLHQQDDEYISVATTTDDNSVRGGKNVNVVSRLHRLWDPLTAASIALITYALPVKDLSVQKVADKRTTVIDLDLRQWDPAIDLWRDTTFTRRFVLPDTSVKRPNLIGFAVVPSTPGVTSWSLIASQPEQRRGRAYHADPGLLDRPLVLSDIVIGSKAQGVTWNLHNVAIPLAPVNSVDRTEQVTLYYQIKSDRDRADLQMTVAFFRVKDGAAADSAALEVSADQAVRRGVNEIAPELDVSRLAKGSYRLAVRITDATGTVIARRSAVLDLN